MSIFDNFQREEVAGALLGALVVKYGGEIIIRFDEIKEFLTGGENQLVKMEFLDEKTIKLELINADQLKEQASEGTN